MVHNMKVWCLYNPKLGCLFPNLTSNLVQIKKSGTKSQSLTYKIPILDFLLEALRSFSVMLKISWHYPFNSWTTIKIQCMLRKSCPNLKAIKLFSVLLSRHPHLRNKYVDCRGGSKQALILISLAKSAKMYLFLPENET